MKAIALRKKETIRADCRKALEEDKSISSVTFMFRPSMEDVMEVIREMPKTKTIYMTRAYMKTTTKNTRELMKIRKIDLKETPRKGKRSSMMGKRLDKTGIIIDVPEKTQGHH